MTTNAGRGSTRRRARVIAGMVALAAAVAPGVVNGTGPANAIVPGTNGQVAFASTRDGNSEIYVMNPDGSAQTRLTTNSVNDTDPAWSPTGATIAFVRAGDIWTMNANGSSPTRLTFFGTLSETPSYTSDGLKIVFAQARDVWVMNADGTGQVNLTNTPLPIQDSSTNVCGDSVNGTIVFNTNRNNPGLPAANGFEIYTMKLDGSGVTRLTNNVLIDSAPGWSPTCHKIVWNAVDTSVDTNFDIHTMNADGTGVTNLTRKRDFDSFGAWSPDGTKIIWTSFRDNDQELYSMNAADGSNPTRLTFITGADVRADWGTAPLLTVAPPVTKDACKNGAYRQYTSPPFKNQGDCVSYYNFVLHNPDTFS